MTECCVAAVSALLREIVRWREQANGHTRESFERLKTTAAYAASFDEDAYRAKIEAELLVRKDIDWAGMADVLGLGGSGLPGARMSGSVQP